MSGEDTVLHCENKCGRTTTWGKILDDPAGQILCDSCKRRPGPVCLMTNCNRNTATDEAMCSKHR